MTDLVIATLPSTISFGGTFRLPASAPTAPASKGESDTADQGRIHLGGTFRLPVVKASAETADAGRIRLGGTFRLV